MFLLKERTHLISTDISSYYELEVFLEKYYVKTNVVEYQKRFNYVMLEIICRDVEWWLIKKELPDLRKEGSVYSI